MLKCNRVKEGEVMNRIKELREKRGLSIDQLSKELKAKGISISPASISKYEREERNPKIENWIKLADFFDVPINYLQGISGAESFAQYLNEKYKLNDNDAYTNKFNNRLKKYFNVFVDNKNVSNKDKILLDTVTSNTLSLLGYMVPIKNTNKADIQRKE